MVYAEFGGQTECIMGNWKIENLNEYHFVINGLTLSLALKQRLGAAQYN